jgi:hypothetical protein
MAVHLSMARPTRNSPILFSWPAAASDRNCCDSSRTPVPSVHRRRR